MSFNCNWSHSECGVAQPIPSTLDGRATCILEGLNGDPYQSMENLQHTPTGLANAKAELVGISSGVPIFKRDMLTVHFLPKKSPLFHVINHKKERILVGCIPDWDHMMGVIAILESYTPYGLRVLESIKAYWVYMGRHEECRPYGALIKHTRTTTALACAEGDGLALETVTGAGQEAATRIPSTDDPDNLLDKSLTTKFTLLKNEVEVARCLMSYRDGSYDPTIGPTFELIEVRSDHYGMGYAQFLFDHAMLFIHENAQILCHGVDSPLNTVMVKATQLLGCVVDAKAVIKDGGEYFETFTDKDLFYRFNRFDVRRAKGVMSMMEMNRIAIHKEAADEEAQSFVLTLTREEVDRRRLELKPAAMLKKLKGQRSCDQCLKVFAKLKKCSRCQAVQFCSVECQKTHWKKHKLVCGKSEKEVFRINIARGAVHWGLSSVRTLPEVKEQGGAKCMWFKKDEGIMGPCRSLTYLGGIELFDPEEFRGEIEATMGWSIY